MKPYKIIALVVFLSFLAGFSLARILDARKTPAPSQKPNISASQSVTSHTTISYKPKPVSQNADMQITTGKPDLRISINGREQTFQKAEEERFFFDKNRITLDQSSDISLNITIEPIDKTRHFGIGVCAGVNKTNGYGVMLSFPLTNRFDGIVIAGKEYGAVGMMIRF